MDSLQQACTLEAELALLLRISDKYGKSGAQVLFSMGALEHISSCKAINFLVTTMCSFILLIMANPLLTFANQQGSLRRVDTKLRRDVAVDFDRQRLIITPVLRLVFSLTSLIDASEFLEVSFHVFSSGFLLYFGMWVRYRYWLLLFLYFQKRFLIF